MGRVVIAVVVSGFVALGAWWSRRKSPTSPDSELPPISPLPFDPIPPDPPRNNFPDWIARRRVGLVRALAWVSLALLAWSAFHFWPVVPPGGNREAGSRLALIGMIGIGAALWLSREAHPTEALPTPLSSPLRRGMLLSGVGGLLIVLVSNSGGFFTVNTGVQITVFLVSAVLIAFGLGGAFRWNVNWRDPSLWTLLAITLLGFGLRLWRLEDAVHAYVDEYHFVEAVNHLRDHPNEQFTLPFGWIAQFSWLYPYTQYLTVNLLGASLSSLRLISVLIGTLTIPAIYALVRAGWTRPVALLTALLLATFPPHVHFSRLALNNIADPLFGVLALALLAHGWRTGKRSTFIWAGVALALTQYFYEGGRLLFPALLLLFALVLARSADRGRRDGLRWMLLTTLLLALPLYWGLVFNQQPIAARLIEKRLGWEYGLGFLSDPLTFFGVFIEPPLLHLIHLPDESGLYYGGQTALLLPYAVPLFMAGMASLLYDARRPLVLTLLLWIAAAVIGNSLIVESRYSARFVVVLPALAIITTLGLQTVTSLAAYQTRIRYLQGILMISAGLLLAAVQVHYYFNLHLPYYNEQIRPYADYIDAAYRMRELPAGTRVYMVSDDDIWFSQIDMLHQFWQVEYVVEIILPDDFTPAYAAALDPAVPSAFFILPDDTTTLSRIRAVFPDVTLEISPYNVPRERQYYLVRPR
jgi:hypothetical protein